MKNKKNKETPFVAESACDSQGKKFEHKHKDKDQNDKSLQISDIMRKEIQTNIQIDDQKNLIQKNLETKKSGDSPEKNKPKDPLKVFPKESVFFEIKSFLKLVLQVVFFWLISELGQLTTGFFSLPIPGSLVGVCLLFVLLLVGVVKVKWIEFGSSVITRHMSLFFIPVTVGIMGYTELLKTSGVSILTTLLVSACVGVIACGLSIKFSQSLKNKNKISSSEQK